LHTLIAEARTCLAALKSGGASPESTQRHSGTSPTLLRSPLRVQLPVLVTREIEQYTVCDELAACF